MCGIAGIFNLNGEPVSPELLRRMTDIISHRGPNDEGQFVDGPIGLGNRRLSIIDLSPAGHQPMSNEDGTLWLTYNGEVYNYLELMPELKEQGHIFRSRTDTETVLHAYESYGEGCLERFNGMWGLALWDKKQRRLFCARDRFGIKPFYYHFDGQVFVFASEIKAILLHPGVRRTVNEAVLYDYLAFSLLDHTDETFFAGIKRLPPAHYLTIDADGRLQVRRWWDLPFNPSLDGSLPGGEDEQIARFRDLLEDSVHLRLRSDVPIGTCLSGGLDSSTIVCMANRLMFDEGLVDRNLVGERQKTFSSCFDDRRFDEREYIAQVIAQTGAEPNHIFPQGAEGLWQELDAIVWHQDEPFGSTSIYAQWSVMRRVRERGVTVVLDGQGGDELLAGYHSYYSYFLAHLLSRGRLLAALREARAAAPTADRQFPYLLATALYIAAPYWLRAMVRGVAWRYRSGGTRRLLREEFKKRFADRNLATLGWSPRRYRANLGEQLHHDTTAFNLPALLRYEDRNSMAFSVEARVPFLDYRLAEYIGLLPAVWHIRDGWTKWVLRQATRGVLPEEIRLRRDKIGFVTTELQWLREGREVIRKLFADGEVRSARYLDVSRTPEALDRALEGREVGTSEAWRWVNLEWWMRRFDVA
jgi:asparagine synthase (glutamine-hydrolysing)